MLWSKALKQKKRLGRKPSPEKRRKILEAAVKLFTTRDYHEVLMDNIAEHAGVGKGTVYRYFPTKEALFLELVNLAVERISEVILEGIDSPAPAIVRLRRGVAMTLEYFRRNEPFLAILYHDKVFRCCRERRDIDERRKQLGGFFVRLIAEGIAERSIRADLEPALAAVVLMAAIRGVLRNFGVQRTSEQLTEQVLSIFIDGVAHCRDGDRASARAGDTEWTLDPDTIAKLDPLRSLTREEDENSELGEMSHPVDGFFKYEFGGEEST